MCKLLKSSTFQTMATHDGDRLLLSESFRCADCSPKVAVIGWRNRWKWVWFCAWMHTWFY